MSQDFDFDLAEVLSPVFPHLQLRYGGRQEKVLSQEVESLRTPRALTMQDYSCDFDINELPSNLVKERNSSQDKLDHATFFKIEYPTRASSTESNEKITKISPYMRQRSFSISEDKLRKTVTMEEPRRGSDGCCSTLFSSQLCSFAKGSNKAVS